MDGLGEVNGEDGEGLAVLRIHQTTTPESTDDAKPHLFVVVLLRGLFFRPGCDSIEHGVRFRELCK